MLVNVLADLPIPFVVSAICVCQLLSNVKSVINSVVNLWLVVFSVNVAFAAYSVLLSSKSYILTGKVIVLVLEPLL